MTLEAAFHYRRLFRRAFRESDNEIARAKLQEMIVHMSEVIRIFQQTRTA